MKSWFSKLKNLDQTAIAEQKEPQLAKETDEDTEGLESYASPTPRTPSTPKTDQITTRRSITPLVLSNNTRSSQVIRKKPSLLSTSSLHFNYPSNSNHNNSNNNGNNNGNNGNNGNNSNTSNKPRKFEYHNKNIGHRIVVTDCIPNDLETVQITTQASDSNFESIEHNHVNYKLSNNNNKDNITNHETIIEQRETETFTNTNNIIAKQSTDTFLKTPTAYKSDSETQTPEKKEENIMTPSLVSSYGNLSNTAIDELNSIENVKRNEAITAKINNVNNTNDITNNNNNIIANNNINNNNSSNNNIINNIGNNSTQNVTNSVNNTANNVSNVNNGNGTNKSPIPTKNTKVKLKMSFKEKLKQIRDERKNKQEFDKFVQKTMSADGSQPVAKETSKKNRSYIASKWAKFRQNFRKENQSGKNT